MRRHLWMMVLLMSLAIGSSVHAQEQISDGDYDVWVTTQRNSNLRSGPSAYFEALAVVDWGVTMPAIGRTYQGDWIQVVWVNENGEQVEGWVAYWLLRWTGNILDLPVDGVNTEPFAREYGPLITITPDTYYYRESIIAANLVMDRVTEPTQVEITGRLGSVTNGTFLIQFRLNGEYYWTGSWAVELPYSYTRAADASYIYPHGRLLLQLRDEIGETRATLSTMSTRWSTLAQSGVTSCNDIPEYAMVNETYLLERDIDAAPIFLPAVSALLTAQENINEAIRRFDDLCTRPREQLVTPEEVQAALTYLSDASRNLTVAETFTAPLAGRDPLVGENR